MSFQVFNLKDMDFVEISKLKFNLKNSISKTIEIASLTNVARETIGKPNIPALKKYIHSFILLVYSAML